MSAALMARRGRGTEDAASHFLRHPGGEPATAELARCRNVGIAAAGDPACKKAWAQNRRRFLRTGEPEHPIAPKSKGLGNGVQGNETLKPSIRRSVCRCRHERRRRHRSLPRDLHLLHRQRLRSAR
ncbi:putative entry exclusion protein TrbK-alt [Mesorhizobium sp. NPDC059025]|uniref:putative entry exclusion protein TrbK-alt n=2 Tax=unclassified Mesorhizobium TaxID=325217 RepID=UPI0036AF6AB0